MQPRASLVYTCQIFLNMNPQQRVSAPLQYTEKLKQIFTNLSKSQKTSKVLSQYPLMVQIFKITNFRTFLQKVQNAQYKIYGKN